MDFNHDYSTDDIVRRIKSLQNRMEEKIKSLEERLESGSATFDPNDSKKKDREHVYFIKNFKS